jgi:predicted nucleotidyltransferase
MSHTTAWSTIPARKPFVLRRVSQRQIQAVVKRIVAEFAPRRIVLFGSYAYGKPRPESDVDLLIVMDTPLRERAQRLLMLRTLDSYPFAIDLIIKTPTQLAERLALGDFFLREVVARGKVLYASPD